MHKLFWIALPLANLVACEKNSNNSQPIVPTYDDALLQKVRVAATAVPGQLPASINYVKYAATVSKWKDILEGGNDDTSSLARTTFQIVYADGYIMVDAGMDRAVHHFFENEGPQPFDDTLASKVAAAVQHAKLILVTHEHGDHVAGVVRTTNNTIPAKTILTEEQVYSLVNNPQMPEIKLAEERSKQYLVTSFESVLPVAPGVVLIKAPGHAKGEIMIYTRLQNGKEYIFTGDVSWTYKGIAENILKPKGRRAAIGENDEYVSKQVAWLQQRLKKDGMVMLISHDAVMLPQYAAQGLINNRLEYPILHR